MSHEVDGHVQDLAQEACAQAREACKLQNAALQALCIEVPDPKWASLPGSFVQRLEENLPCEALSDMEPI